MAEQRTTYVLVDGENIDATLGNSIMGRRPRPEERPRWERVLEFAREEWQQPATGLFFLAANNELPMTFVQALLAIGFRPIALSGSSGEKVVDIAIQRTLGLTPMSVMRIFVVQGTLIGIIGTVLGVLLGLIAARRAPGARQRVPYGPAMIAGTLLAEWVQSPI